MKKNILLGFLLITFIANLVCIYFGTEPMILSQNQGLERKAVSTSLGLEDEYTLSWNLTWGSEYKDFTRSIAIDSKGNIYVAGTHYTNDIDYYSFISKIDKNGVFLKNLSFQSSYLISDICIDANNDDLYAVQNLASDLRVLRYDENGNLLNNESFIKADSQYADQIELDSDKNIFIVGRSSGAFQYGYLVKINSSFEEEWDHQWLKVNPDTLEARFSTLDMDQNEDIIVAGNIRYLVGGEEDYFLGKYNSSGALKNQSWWGEVGKYERIKRIECDENDYTYGISRYSLMKFYPNQSSDWDYTFSTYDSYSYCACDVFLDEEDIFTVRVIGTITDKTLQIEKFNETGQRQWVSEWGYINHTDSSGIYQTRMVAKNSNGDFYIAVDTYDYSTNFDNTLIKYTALTEDGSTKDTTDGDDDTNEPQTEPEFPLIVVLLIIGFVTTSIVILLVILNKRKMLNEKGLI
ncbi:MAG: SBBP repeat-containing protein [Promethearchaeota archaeon]